jgi:hypothetical protein
MESQIRYDRETTLNAPDGVLLTSISVTVELDPPDSGCLIYGTLRDGNMGCIEVRGARSEIDLPFANPKIYVKYLKGLSSFQISTRSFRDPRL